MSSNGKVTTKAPLRYDPSTMGYNVVNESPEVNERHKEGHVYFTKEAMQREIDEVFMKQWLFVGRVEEVEKPGDYFTNRVGDEPIVVIKEKNGNIQAFANVCRHRGVQVAWDSGNTKYFTCPYHGWVYDTSGQLVDAQYTKGVQNFKKENCRLPRLRTEIWEGFIFIYFDNEAGGLIDDLNGWDFPKIYEPYQMGRLKLSNKFQLELACNWKFVNENVMDIYHIAVLHSDTVGPLQPLDGYRYQVFDGGFHGRFLGGTIAPEGKSLFGPMPWLPEELHSGGFSTHLPPNLAWFPRFDYVAVQVTWPISPESCSTVVYLMFPEEYFDQPGFLEKAKVYEDFYLSILGEDIEMIKSLQKGVKSRYYEPGPATPFEAGVMGTIKHNVDDLGYK